MALIVGIVLAYLTQVRAYAARRWAWFGVAAAIAVSLLFLGTLIALDKEFEGTTEQVFEGSTMLLATAFLTWMILWMARNSRSLKGELQRGMAVALLLFAAPGEGKLLGSLIGLAGAVGIGVLIYAFGRRIDLRSFFKVTTALLILFAAGLFSHAARELVEAGLLEPVEGPVVWSTKALLSQDEGLGSILRALFGYADTPHVIEVVTYAGYFVIAWLLSRTRLARAPITAPRPAASS